MPLSRRAIKKERSFNIPVSYRVFDRGNKFLDALNVMSVQGRLDTRHGTARYNTESLGGTALSLSFFTKSSGSRYCLAKVGGTIKSVSTSSTHTDIKTGLSSGTKHRAVTTNDRHVIAIEGDGVFTYNGSTFTQLGQAAPTTLTATVVSGGSLTNATSYQAAITFYASSVGFETNKLTSSIVLTATPNLRVALSDIPATATNALVDKVRIYLKDVTNNGDFFFIDEIDLGTTTYNIDSESLSAQTPPIDNGPVPSGGGKYLALFNSKLVLAGTSSFPNEVYFSEENLPDAFNPNDTQTVLVIPGQGGVTGIAVGMFNDSSLDPFLVIFKRKSTHVYSELNGDARLTPLSFEIGCVSHDTIQVKNGVVYFLSEEGWRAINNGRLVVGDGGNAITLGNGDIDDIFKTPGYIYEVNRTEIINSFSVYYPTLDQYITWVAEGSNSQFSKAYCYEFQVGGFKPWQFAVVPTCATLGEDSTGRDQVLLGTSDGYILKHSVAQARSDVDATGSEVAIDCFGIMTWAPDDGDMDATYNFRELILRAITSSNELTVKTFLNFNLSNIAQSGYQFTDPNSGFILDVSKLDEGVFGDERAIVTARSDINRVGESIAIGFYQSIINANMALVSAQLDLSKNGNRN
jgi:hypothetical protein